MRDLTSRSEASCGYIINQGLGKTISRFSKALIAWGELFQLDCIFSCFGRPANLSRIKVFLISHIYALAASKPVGGLTEAWKKSS